MDRDRELCTKAPKRYTLSFLLVEAFRADPTPRYWQRHALKPHHLAARFELETST